MVRGGRRLGDRPTNAAKSLTVRANTARADNIARPRELLAVPKPHSNAANSDTVEEPPTLAHPCPCCGGRMIIIEIFERGHAPRYRPTAPTVTTRIDTS